jgi:hypothetical protein
VEADEADEADCFCSDPPHSATAGLSSDINNDLIWEWLNIN